MKIVVGYVPLESDLGVPLLSQNRQFQWFSKPTYVYPMVPASAATLLASKGLQGNAIGGLQHQSAAQQGVVDAQRALLISAKDESRAKLLVERAYGELGQRGTLRIALRQSARHVEVGHAPSLEIVLEAWQRMLQILQTCACLDELMLEVEVDVGVGEHIVGLLRSNLVIVLRQEDVTLDASAQSDLLAIVLR